MNTTNKMIHEIFETLEDKKAEDINILNISNISSIADYFIIANGTNINQVQAMADAIGDKLNHSIPDIKDYPYRIEGYQKANWILIDYGTIVVHIFDKENREFYKLEKIWSDAKKTKISEI